MSQIRGSHSEAEFKRRYSDQQIGQWKPNALCLILAIDQSRVKRNGRCYRIDRDCRSKVLNEPQTPFLS